MGKFNFQQSSVVEYSSKLLTKRIFIVSIHLEWLEAPVIDSIACLMTFKYIVNYCKASGGCVCVCVCV